MEKVKLPKEVAEAIEFHRDNFANDYILFDLSKLAVRARAIGNQNARQIVAFTNKSEENKKKYFEALINGYEVDTPEKQIEEMFRKAQVDYVAARPGSFEEGKAIGIVRAIEEVNKKLNLGLRLDV